MKDNLFIRRIEKYVNIILLCVFIIAILAAVKLSDIIVPFNCSIFNALFIHHEPSDPILSGVITGYITGYIVYVLTAWLPAHLKSAPYKQDTLEILQGIYLRSVLTLLLMYKGACTGEEWVALNRRKDLAYLNDQSFLKRMKYFDINADAYTLYGNKETKKRWKWCEYLGKECGMIQEKASDLLSSYGGYLDYEMIMVLLRLKNSHFIGMMTGNDQNSIITLKTQSGQYYFDAISAQMYYDNNQYGIPIFSKPENMQCLRSYIEILTEIRNLIDGLVQNEEFDYQNMERICSNNTGEAGYAICKMKE